MGGATSTAVAMSVREVHQLCQGLPQGQGHQEVRHQEHRGGRCREGYLRRQRVHPVPAAQALRQAGLLCELRHPFQGGEKQKPGSQEGPDSAAKVWILRPQTSAGSRSQARRSWSCKDLNPVMYLVVCHLEMSINI